MTDPACPQKAPYVVSETPGDKFWCACGHSQKQPYCDGSHQTKAPGIRPVKTTIDSPKKVAWCGCKRSGEPPFCDGTHSKI